MKKYRLIFSVETTASHQKSTAAEECDSPAANGVTEHEKLTSHVFNLHPKNSTRSLRLSSDLTGRASCTFNPYQKLFIWKGFKRYLGVRSRSIRIKLFKVFGEKA